MTTRTDFQMITSFDGYTPEDRHFTSAKEKQQIADHFELENRTAIEMQNLRDMVVLVYSQWIEVAAGVDSDNYLKQTAAMQSITAVIDYYKYR